MLSSYDPSIPALLKNQHHSDKYRTDRLACGATDLIIGKRVASLVKSWGSNVGSPAVNSEVTIPTATASPKSRLTVSRPWPLLVAAGMKARAACSNGTCANPPRFQMPYRGWWAAACSLGSAEAVPYGKRMPVLPALKS